MRDFYIIDTTLRDGEQSPGVAFLKKEKIEIANALNEAGVDYIEVGIPVMGKEEKESIREIISMNLSSKILTWNRMNKYDIDESLSCGSKHVHIAVPSSDIHIFKKIKKDRQWVISKLDAIVSYAIKKGCIVSVGAEDASRADEEFLIKLYKTAVNAGAIRLRYADTLGILTPNKTFNAIERIVNEINVDLDFHAHNDFGLATANTLSAFEAGAKYFSCSISNLGERAGNTALEEIISTLKILLKCNHPFNLKKVMGLSKIVQDASGRVLGDNKPIVGEYIFSHESGIHVDGLLKDLSTYEAFPPEVVGRKRQIILGKFSGSSSIIHALKERNVLINKKEADLILQEIRRSYMHDKKPDIESILQKWIHLLQKSEISSF